MDKLKPCPFCGGKEVYAEISYITKEFRIYCAEPDCDCLAEMSLSFADAGFGDGDIIGFDEMTTVIKQMIELWNTRTQNKKEN